MKKNIIIAISTLIILLSILFVSSILLFPIKYKNEIDKYSKKYDISPALILSIINVESSFQKDAISKANAKGLMQLTTPTANEIANKLNVENYNIFNIDTNIEFGTFYLRYLLNRYNNNLNLALASYNAGLNNVDNWIKNKNYYKDNTLIKTPFKETNIYIKKVGFNYKIYKLKY